MCSMILILNEREVQGKWHCLWQEPHDGTAYVL